MVSFSVDDKREALRNLVREAYSESAHLYPSMRKVAGAPEFDPAGFQEYHMQTLLTALKTTDALEVLYNWLGEKD